MSQPIQVSCRVGNNPNPIIYKYSLTAGAGVGEESAKIDDYIQSLSTHFLLPISRAEKDSEIRFNELKQTWEKETEHLSAITEISMHPAYQQIIGMGKEALPHIMKELATMPTHWFWALRSITGENPIPADKIGKVNEMAEAWLMWYIRNKPT